MERDLLMDGQKIRLVAKEVEMKFTYPHRGLLRDELCRLLKGSRYDGDDCLCC